MNLNFLKNKVVIASLCVISVFCLSACGKNYLNEKKENFVNDTKKSEISNVEMPDEKDRQEDSKQKEDYVKVHSDSEYEDLMISLEICIWDDTFEKPEELESLQNYFGMFLTDDYTYEEIDEMYNAETSLYEVPGSVIREVLYNHMDFENSEIDLKEYFPLEGYSWYDETEDMYYTRVVTGFGGEHYGYDSLEFEVLDYGIVKATGVWTTEINTTATAVVIVKEDEDGHMKLRSFQHSVVENENSEDFSTENIHIDATKGAVTLTGTLEYRCTESSANPEVMKELYILHLDQEISELIYFNYDSEKNEVAEGITEIDVIGDAELLEGWVHDGKRVTITGEIIPNYTMYFFNQFSIIQEQLEFN